MAQNLDSRCGLVPSTLGAGAKARVESRTKRLTPHCICRYENPDFGFVTPCGYLFNPSVYAAAESAYFCNAHDDNHGSPCCVLELSPYGLYV